MSEDEYEINTPGLKRRKKTGQQYSVLCLRKNKEKNMKGNVLYVILLVKDRCGKE